jgi:hypothetical protein
MGLKGAERDCGHEKEVTPDDGVDGGRVVRTTYIICDQIYYGCDSTLLGIYDQIKTEFQTNILVTYL